MKRAKPEASEPPAHDVAAPGGSTTSPTSAADPPTRAKTRLLALVAWLACIAFVGWYFVRRSATPTGAPASEPIEIVGDKADLSAGSDVVVYWHAYPVGDTFGRGAPFAESFTVTASAGATGRGAITGEQVFARIEQLGVDKLVEAVVRDPRPGEPVVGSAGAAAVTDSPSVELSRWVRVDAKGRAVLFLDLETWAPGQPEPDCRRSAECARSGRCTAREGSCIATTDADCAASRACRESGDCSARDGGCSSAEEPESQE